jgi:hypothetical protein
MENTLLYPWMTSHKSVGSNQSFQFVPARTGLHRTPFSPLRCVKVAAEYWR